MCIGFTIHYGCGHQTMLDETPCSNALATPPRACHWRGMFKNDEGNCPKCKAEKGNKRKRVLDYQEVTPEKKTKIDRNGRGEDKGEDGDGKKRKRSGVDGGVEKKQKT